MVRLVKVLKDGDIFAHSSCCAGFEIFNKTDSSCRIDFISSYASSEKKDSKIRRTEKQNSEFILLWISRVWKYVTGQS